MSNFGTVRAAGLAPRSDSTTWPLGPLGWTDTMSTPRSRAALRTAGMALTSRGERFWVAEVTTTSSVGSSPTTDTDGGLSSTMAGAGA